MSAALLEQVGAALGAFASVTRLYQLSIGEGEDSSRLVEAFAGDEQLQTPGARDVIVLSTSAQLALATLQVSLLGRRRRQPAHTDQYHLPASGLGT